MVTAEEKKALWQQDQEEDRVVQLLLDAHKMLMGLPDILYTKEIRDVDHKIIDAMSTYRAIAHPVLRVPGKYKYLGHASGLW